MRGDLDEPSEPGDGTSPSSRTTRHETLLASVDPALVKAVVKPLLGMGSLVFLLLVVSFLPGLDRVIPATPITFSALVMAVFATGIVGVLVYVAPQLEQLMQQRFGRSGALATNAAAIVKHLDLLLAVYVAHWGLAGALLPFLSDTGFVWSYDLVFLFLALIPTVHVTRHLYLGLDPAAEALTRRITSSGGSLDGGASEGATDPATRDRAAPPSPSDRGPTARRVRSVLAPVLETSRWPRLGNGVAGVLRGRPDRHGGVLTKEERVLQVLEAHDGRIQQTEIVELTGWSKSTVSRVLSEMKERGAIVKTNIGQGNLISLPGEEPEGVASESTDRGP